MVIKIVAIGLAALTVLSGVGSMLIFPELGPVAGLIGLVLQLAGTIAVAFLRPPYAAATVVIITAAVAWLPTGWQVAYDHEAVLWIPIAATIASNRLVIESRSRIELIISSALVAVWCMITIVNNEPSLIVVLAGIAPVLGGICFALLSRLAGARKDRLATLQQARLSAEREQLLADLHDLITHRITRVVLRSRQLATPDRTPEVRDGLAEIERTATETLTALRDYLITARPVEPSGAGDDARPLAELQAQLGEIVEAERRLDRSVRLGTTIHDGRIMINSAVSACLIGATREALTNAAKHAAGASVTVALAADDRVRLSVINEPPPAGPDAKLRQSGSGTGLRGLGRRCQLLGGQLTAEPDERGGFAVRVDLPLNLRAATLREVTA